MKKSLELLMAGFESSSGVTEEFKKFYRTFKSEFSKILKGMGVIETEFTRLHFGVSVFFKLSSGHCYYLSISDVRDIAFTFRSPQLLIRTVKDFKDYKGGPNHYIFLDEDFETNLRRGVHL